MAYGGTARNRPIIATTITRSVSGGLSNSNRVLRRYYNRILLVLAVTAVYTVFIYKSGAFVPARLRPRSVVVWKDGMYIHRDLFTAWLRLFRSDGVR